MRRRVDRAVVAAIGCVSIAAGSIGCPSSDPGLSGGQPMSTGSGPATMASTVAVPADTEAPPETRSPQGLLFDSSGRLVVPDAGTPQPIALKTDSPLQAERLAHEDLTGVTLEVAFRMRHLPPAAKVPEAQADGIAKAQKLTALTSTIDLASTGRMRWQFTSRALPFAFRTEIRARYDRYGNILLWPNDPKYRAMPPGSLRTAIDEGRIDVTPLSPGNTKGAPAAGKRLDEKTRIVTIESPLGKIKLELANIPEASFGGPLLCRALVELVGVDPATPECKDDEVPLFAALDFEGGDGIDFEATLLSKRTDMSPAAGVCPPPGAEFQPTGMPDVGAGIFLQQPEIAAFRSKPDPKIEPKPGAPGDGLLLENGRDQLMYFALDGVLVASVPPLSSRYVFGLQKGRYSGQWRTFLGDQVDSAQDFDAPAKITNVRTPPQADAGAP